MILNGYDTLVGNKFKISENIPSTIKTLSTTNRLTPFNEKRGIYVIDRENGEGIPNFVFPLTVKDYRGNTVTVFDQRLYANASGRIVNTAEYSMAEAAASLQQLAAKGDIGVLLTAETYTVKAFAGIIGRLLGRQSGLDLSKQLELTVILGHYYSCLLTNPSDDYAFISQNVIKRALGTSPEISAPIIEEVGYINTLPDLIEAIKTNPRLPTLNRLTAVEFVSVANRIWHVLSGFKMIIGASLEAPQLFTAICYATVTNNYYRKTEIGQALDQRNNPNIVSFVKVVADAIN